MHQIVYVSAATAPMDVRALEHLLRQCRRNNEEYNLTGLLIYKDERFMQVLEGPNENVKHMYTTIREDDRHTGIIQMAGHALEERDFPGWPMAFRTNRDPGPRGVQDLAPRMDEAYRAEPFTDDLSFSHRMLLDFLDAEQEPESVKQRQKALSKRENAVEERENAVEEREAAVQKREEEVTG